MRNMIEKKKYIIEFEEDPTTIRLVKLKNGEDGLPCMQFMTVSPYKYDEAYQKGVHDTATEIEAIKDEAYNRGRKDAIDEIGCNEKEIATKACQSGLDDGKKMGMELMWEVIRKIILPSKRGGFTIDEFVECFGRNTLKYDVLEDYSASEAVDRVRKYEQKREEIHLGDEVTFLPNNAKGIVTECHVPDVYSDNDKYAVWCGETMEYVLKQHLTKTGRTFPEIVEVMRKMKEG
jgi:hypothetical protein